MSTAISTAMTTTAPVEATTEQPVAQPLSILSRLVTDSGKPLVINEGGVPITTSYLVAEFFHKRHDNVFRDIEALESRMGDEFVLNFEASSVINELANGRSDPYYKMTEEGFTLLAMGFAGEKAFQFKLAYVKAFRLMKDEVTRLTEQNTLLLKQSLQESQTRLDKAYFKMERLEMQNMESSHVWNREEKKAVIDKARWAEQGKQSLLRRKESRKMKYHMDILVSWFKKNGHRNVLTDDPLVRTAVTQLEGSISKWIFSDDFED